MIMASALSNHVLLLPTEAEGMRLPPSRMPTTSLMAN